MSKGSSSPQRNVANSSTPVATPIATPLAVRGQTGTEDKDSYKTNDFTSFVPPSLTDTSMMASNSQTNTFSKPSTAPPLAGFMLDVGVEAAIISSMKKDRRGFLEPPPSPKASSRHKRHQKFNNTMKTGYILNRLTKQPKPKPDYSSWSKSSRSDYSSRTFGDSSSKHGKSKYSTSSSKYGEGKYAGRHHNTNKRRRAVSLATSKSSAKATRTRKYR